MKTQLGRSMIEMLGVLAIVGVLSVGGLAGYTRAMRSKKINDALDYMGRTKVVLYEGVASGTISATAGNIACDDLLDEDLPAGVADCVCDGSKLCWIKMDTIELLKELSNRVNAEGGHAAIDEMTGIVPGQESIRFDDKNHPKVRPYAH